MLIIQITKFYFTFEYMIYFLTIGYYNFVIYYQDSKCKR